MRFCSKTLSLVGPGGVAQWTPHPPQERKPRVRIPPGYKIFGGNMSMLTLHMHGLCWKLEIKETGLLAKETKKTLSLATLFFLKDKNVPCSTRVARFFLVQNTKKGKNIPNYHTQYQMSIKYNLTP
jgi:hypothetical protein